MTVSIVVPAHNSERYLAATVRSVLGQTIPDWELVIVDDGSTDSTATLVRSFAEKDQRIRLIEQMNSGMAAARNRGFADTSAESEYVIFLDHDDLWHTDALAILVRALEAHPEAVAAGGLARYIDSDSEPCRLGQMEAWGRQRRGVVGDKVAVWPRHAPTPLAVLAYRNCIATAGLVIFRRWALEAAGRFDAAAVPCDDWDMWLRLSLSGDIAFVDRVLLDWRAHPGNASNRHPLAAGRQGYVRRKLLSTPTLTEDQRRLATAANRFWAQRAYTIPLRSAGRRLARGELRLAATDLWRAAVSYAQWRGGLPAP